MPNKSQCILDNNNYKIEFKGTLYGSHLGIDFNSIINKYFTKKYTIKKRKLSKVTSKKGLFLADKNKILCSFEEKGEAYYTTIIINYELLSVAEDSETIKNKCYEENKEIYNVFRFIRLLTNEHIFILFPSISVSGVINDKEILNYSAVDINTPSLSLLRFYRKIDYNRLNSRLALTLPNDSYLKKVNENNILKRACEYYDSSFFQHCINIKFLLLFTALESLFNNSNDAIQFKLALYTSTFIKDSKEERERTFNNIKTLYNIRSKLTHGNEIKKVTPEEEEKLREYTRLAILRYIDWSIKTKKGGKDDLIKDIEKIIFSGKNLLDFTDYK